MPDVVFESQQKRQHELEVEIAAAYRQMGFPIDEVTRTRLKRQVQALEAERDELIKRIARYQAAGRADPTAQESALYTRHWDQHLPKLNFREAAKVYTRALERLDSQEGGFIFLLQNSHVMRGDLLASRFFHELYDHAALVRNFEIVFEPFDLATPEQFLQRLAEYVHVRRDPGGDAAGWLEAITDTICGSLQSGSIVYLKLNLYSLDAAFLNWFVCQFWETVLRAVSARAASLPLVRFFAVIAVKKPILASLLNDCCCRDEEFDQKKIVNLPLQKWSSKEIRHWLLQFSGLVPEHLQREQVDKMADEIYESSESGRPESVVRCLEEVLETLLKSQPASAPTEGMP